MTSESGLWFLVSRDPEARSKLRRRYRRHLAFGIGGCAVSLALVVIDVASGGAVPPDMSQESADGAVSILGGVIVVFVWLFWLGLGDIIYAWVQLGRIRRMEREDLRQG